MNATPPSHRRIAVIGGGITGVAAAHHCRELDGTAEVVLYEASDRLGGVVRTEERDGYLIEHGADMFTTRDPWGLGLARRIGFDGELINTSKENARALVLCRGRLCPIPEGFVLMSPGRMWPIVKSPILSWRGKLRMAAEYFVPPRRDGQDESLADFVTRRLGREAYERLVQPLIGGIYTADPHQLSMQAALPQFVQMEREHGGLIRALRHRDKDHGQAPTSASGARYGLFVAPRRGMESFLQAIAGQLSATSVRLHAMAESIRRTGDGKWQVQFRDLPSEAFDAVIVATPTQRAADLLAEIAPQLAGELKQIVYASAAIVAVGVRRDQIRHPLKGFGIVVPHVERRKILAASLASLKFPGRAPDGAVLIRVFIGGALQPELAELPDSELEELALSELRSLIGLEGKPELLRVIRWRQAMPQYHLGHLERIGRIEALSETIPQFALAGNGFRGVGLPLCIRSGEQAAERICAV